MVRASPILYDMRPRFPLALDLCSLITADSRLFRSGKNHHPAIALLA